MPAAPTVIGAVPNALLNTTRRRSPPNVVWTTCRSVWPLNCTGGGGAPRPPAGWAAGAAATAGDASASGTARAAGRRKERPPPARARCRRSTRCRSSGLARSAARTRSTRRPSARRREPEQFGAISCRHATAHRASRVKRRPCVVHGATELTTGAPNHLPPQTV